MKTLYKSIAFACVLGLGSTLQSTAQIGSSVSVNVTPEATIGAISDQTFCEGGTSVNIPFTGTGTSYAVSGGSALGIADAALTASPIIFTPSTIGTATITVLATNGTCEGEEITFNVTVLATPTATAPENITVCLGSEVLATGFAGLASSYEIDGGTSGLAASTVASSTIPAFTASTVGTHTITITPLAGDCEGTAVSYTVEVIETPTVDPVTIADLCAGADLDVSFTGTATTYSWTNDNVTIGIAASGEGSFITPTSASLTATTTANFAVTPSVTSASTTCEGAVQNFVVTVNPLPNGTFASDVEICEGTNALIAFNATAGTAPYIIEYKKDGIGATIPVTTPLNSGDMVDVGVHTTDANYQLWKITDVNGCIAE